jgi:hypothetical protein
MWSHVSKRLNEVDIPSQSLYAQSGKALGTNLKGSVHDLTLHLALFANPLCGWLGLRPG